jgi:Domain of unknown function (DUF6458)
VLEVVSMGIGASAILIAIGAILAFAVDYELSGVDIAAIGWILMIVGGLGLVVTLVIWAPRRPREPREPRERRESASQESRRRTFGRGDDAGAYPPDGRGGEMVQYYAGVDAYGRERWVVGQIERRERRQDGDWVYLRPAPQGQGNAPDPAWVAADQTRIIPTYGSQEGQRR